MLLRNYWITEKLRGNLKKTQRNENESTMVENLWDAAKAVLSGKFMAICSCLKKQEKPQTT